MPLFMQGPSASPWQNTYAKPNWQGLLTHLAPQQEQQFQTWAALNNVPVTPDYDMRAFYMHQFDPSVRTAQDANDGMLHYPDTYKTPLHQSFSGESIYANPAAHPPMWNDRDQLALPNGKVLFDERKRR